MAIQLRRGVYADFDPTKLMPGEVAVVTADDPDGAGGQAIYMCFGSSVVKRLIEYADVEDMLAVPIALGQGTRAIIESDATSAGGDAAHAEGYETKATGNHSHAEGANTESRAVDSHAEGYLTLASGNGSHAEGASTVASGVYSHAEGYDTDATGYYAHAECNNTTASGDHSHAEGFQSVSSGINSHAEGSYTISKHNSQHVFGKYNVADPSSAGIGNSGTYAEIVGNGTADNARSNARTLDWSGNETLSGKLTVGAAPTADMDAATKKYVDDATSGATATYTDPDGDGNIVITLG